MTDQIAWQFGHATEADWQPWGSANNASARMVASADDRHLLEVRANAGYVGQPHDHTHSEFTYVIAGRVRSNGHELGPGDGCAAPAGSAHTDFEALTDARYLLVFRF